MGSLSGRDGETPGSQQAWLLQCSRSLCKQDDEDLALGGSPLGHVQHLPLHTAGLGLPAGPVDWRHSSSDNGPGNFGLWRWCSDNRDGFDVCRGALPDFSSIISPAFRAATVFTGLSVVVTVCAILIWLAICFTSTAGLFKFSGVLQIISGMFMLIVILSYPAGWDNTHVVSVYGDQADDFSLGTCSIRWSYMLAVITCCDAFLLGFLALTLSNKQIRLE